MNSLDTKTDMTRREKFLAMVRVELPKTYDWAKVEFRLNQYMHSVVGAMNGHDTLMLADSPVLERCWRAVGMRCKLTCKNMKKL